MQRITTTFRRLRRSGRTALMPFLTLGYPQRDSALSLVPAIADAGADILELGVPFSDPLADGATIQAASQRALRNGMTLHVCLEQVATLRARGATLPFVLMSYYNPILQFGLEAFAASAAVAGVDGLIVPDLPPEEAGAAQAALDAHGVDLVLLLAPTSDAQRITTVAHQSRSFLYLVSLVGVTGARDQLTADLTGFVDRVRAVTDKPLAVGFGIGTPEQAAQVAHIADGVIVGSALVREIGGAASPETTAASFVRALRNGIDHPGL